MRDWNLPLSPPEGKGTEKPQLDERLGIRDEGLLATHTSELLNS